MNFFEKFLYFLQGKMNTPVAFGWFHLLWLGLIIVSIFILYKLKHRFNERQLKFVLFIYGMVALIFEILKQLIWAFNFDSVTSTVNWDYEWYSFPFQLCTTPMIVSIICFFLKSGKVRKSLLSYMSFVTIIGGIMTIFMPDSCFTSDILINIHTMWLHFGGFVVSIYLLMSGAVEIKLKNLRNAFFVFLIFVGIAEILNIVVYNIGVLNGETFNMFYISPYFISNLPVFDVIQQNVPYVIYVLIYILAVTLGSFIIYLISLFISKLTNRKVIKK